MIRFFSHFRATSTSHESVAQQFSRGVWSSHRFPDCPCVEIPGLAMVVLAHHSPHRHRETNHRSSASESNSLPTETSSCDPSGIPKKTMEVMGMSYGYGSIPINTIFRGMNIHKSQLFWCELQGYKVLTHCHIFGYDGTVKKITHQDDGQRWLADVNGPPRPQKTTAKWKRHRISIHESINVGGNHQVPGGICCLAIHDENMIHFCRMGSYYCPYWNIMEHLWLVVDLPLWKIWK